MHFDIFIFSVLSGVPQGYVMGNYDKLSETMPASVFWSFNAFKVFVQATVIYYLTSNLTNKRLMHIVLVVLLSCLISSSLMWGLVQQIYLDWWQLDYALLALAVFLGTSLNSFWRRKNDVLTL